MLRNIFLKTFHEQRRSLMWWAVGLLCYALMIAAFYPSIQGMPQFNDFIQMAPKELMAAFIGNLTDLTSPAGYLNSQIFFMIAPLLLLVYAVSQGSRAVAGEEDRGTLDLLLANPIPRWRVVAEKFGAMVCGAAGLAAMLWLGLAAGALWVKMDVDLGHMAEASLAAAMLGLVFGALALALGCATGNRGVSVGVASAAALVAYFLNTLAPLVKKLSPFQKLSPFYFYSSSDPLVNGLNAGHVAVLAGLTALFFAVALVSFQRRDLAV